MMSDLQKIKEAALKQTELSVVLGQFKGMLKMYQQDNLPKEEIQEIKEILKELKGLQAR